MSLHAQNHIKHKPRLILNKTDHNSFAPFRYGDKIYFSSRFLPKSESAPITRLFSKNLHGWNFQLLDINPTKKTTHISNLSMTPDGKTIYYSICLDDTQDKCSIWSRKKGYDGKWGTATKLPAHINLRKYTATQPSIGYDLDLRKKVLYFVSDRPEGKGGKDIWQSVIELDGTFGVATPLPVNTPQDDITPFFQQSKQTLFFSSNGHKGHGGFDIFSTHKTGKTEWSDVENIGAVVNTGHNESYFTYHTNQKKAYFTSDQPVGQKDVKASCVYEVEPSIELTLSVFSTQNMQSLHGTTVRVYDETFRQNYTYLEQPFDADLKIIMLPEREYKIVVSKDGFMPSVLEFNTKGHFFPTAIENRIYLSEGEAKYQSNKKSYQTSHRSKGLYKANTYQVKDVRRN